MNSDTLGRIHPAVRPVVLLMRPAFMFLVVSIALIGSASASTSRHDLDSLALAMAIGGWALFAIAVNDYNDRDVDRANLAHTGTRPLIDFDVSRSVFRAVLVTSVVVSLTAVAFVSVRSTIVLLCGFALAAAYSLPPMKLSSRGALTSFGLPLIYVVVPFLTGRWSANTQLDRHDLLLLAGLYVAFIGRLMLKDFRDHLGDRLYGKRTFLVRHGRERTSRTSALLTILGTSVILIAQDSPRFALLVIPLIVISAVFTRRVGRDEWGHGDVYNIAIVAIAGRGILTMTLADLALRSDPAVYLWWIVQAGLLIITATAALRFALASQHNPAAESALPSVPPTWVPSTIT